MGERRPEHRIGVVIPARNEAECIRDCLRSLDPFLREGGPIVVVDAASRDDTRRLASRPGVRVLCSADGARGHALARGYREMASRVEVVLLVHADMVVPPEARSAILDVLDSHADAVGGALGHRIDDPRIRFRWIEAGNRFRARRWQLPYGDQAQFVRTKAVDSAGGFPLMPALEDLELTLRLRRLGPWLYVDCPVRIPARHWRQGVLRTTLRNWSIALGYGLRRSGRLRRSRAGREAGRRQRES